MRPTKTTTTRDPLEKTASRALGLATSVLDVAVRNLDKGKDAVDRIRQATPDADVVLQELDLGSRSRFGKPPNN